MKTKTMHRPTLTGLLTASLADTFRLYAATHVAHWNVRGPHFPQLHTLFETQYNDLWQALDTLAERIRHYGDSVDPKTLALDEPVPVADGDWKTVVRTLAKDNRALSERLRALEDAATESGDPATADLAVERIRAHDQAAWMLEAILE